MSAIATLRTLLLADSSITDIVSTRIYFIYLPPEVTIPAMTLREISGATNSQDASSFDLHTTYRVQFDLYHTNAVQLKTLRDAVLSVLNRYSGTANSQDVVDITFDLMFDLYSPETGVYRQVMDAKVMVNGS